jgi:hypothetical protein
MITYMTLENNLVTDCETAMFAGNLLVPLFVWNPGNPLLLQFGQMEIQVCTNPVKIRTI